METSSKVSDFILLELKVDFIPSEIDKNKYVSQKLTYSRHIIDIYMGDM